LQEAQVQLRNAQDVMFRLKEKSKKTDPVSVDHNLISDSNQMHENQMLQKEIASLLKKYVGNNKMYSILSYYFYFLPLFRIEVDELKKTDLAAEKLNLEMALNNIQFENKNSVKREQFLNLSTECNTITSLTKTNLNNIVQKLKDCLNELETVNVSAITDQG
jgi:hypothetical protein